jgi:hypothetical protein
MTLVGLRPAALGLARTRARPKEIRLKPLIPIDSGPEKQATTGPEQVQQANSLRTGNSRFNREFRRAKPTRSAG